MKLTFGEFTTHEFIILKSLIGNNWPDTLFLSFGGIRLGPQTSKMSESTVSLSPAEK